MIQFTLNGHSVQTDVDPKTPLLWVVRDQFKLKGSKFGCGAGLCGACTMHVDGAALKTCVTPIAAVANKSITTIEGLGTPKIYTLCRRRGMNMQCLSVVTVNRGRLWRQRRSLMPTQIPAATRLMRRWLAIFVAAAAIHASSARFSR